MDADDLELGLTIDLPTGRIADFLAQTNPELQKLFCDVVNQINFKVPLFTIGLVPSEDSCSSGDCPTKHVLYVGRPCGNKD